MSDSFDAIKIPTGLKACQTLMGELTHAIDLCNHTIESHAHTIESHAHTIEELHERNQKLEQEKQELELAMAELLQRAFRRRSERYIEDPNQLKLDFGDSAEAADAAEGLKQALEEAEQTIGEHTRRRPRKKPRNEKLPEHLPRYEVEADVPEDVKHCSEDGERKLIAPASTVITCRSIASRTTSPAAAGRRPARRY